MPFKYNPYSGQLDWVLGPGSGTATIQFDTDSGSATPTGAGVITFSGDSSGIDTSASGNTVTLSFDVTEQPAIPTSITTDSGTVTPALNAFVIAGGDGISTSGATDTVTVTLDTPVTVANGGTGSTTLNDHGILLGSGTSAITPLAAATDGQLPIGSTGADPVLATLTGSNGVDVTNAAGAITLGSKVVQIVSNLNIAGSSTSSVTLVDVTGASLAITPTSASNKVLVIFSYKAEHSNVAATNVSYFASVLRGATDISGADVIQARSFSGIGNDGLTTWINYMTIDSPATTSATTYKLQHRGSNASGTYSSENINIILMEIVA